ncbi:cytochrome P450 [Clavulina sp. PMI_390]|nr:cytochrome P450 [Clavulina sp. PMI_390]
MTLPPGVPYLLQLLPGLAGPPLVVFAALHYLGEHELFKLTQLNVWPWIRLALVLLSFPVTILVRDFLADVSNWRQARKMGAKPLPQLRGRWYIPAGMDMVVHFVSSLKWEYAGESLGEAMRVHNKTSSVRVNGEYRVITKEPRYIKRILAGNFNNYVKGENPFRRATRPVLGVGVFNSDGAMWKFHRTLARPFFSRERISDFKIFEKHADEIIEIMKAAFNDGTPLNIQDVYARFTLDSATEFLMGDCPHSIHEPMLLPGGVQPKIAGSTGRTSAFVKAIAVGQEHISTRLHMGRAWPSAEIFRDNSIDYVPHLDAYLNPILEKAMLRRAELLEERDVKNAGSGGAQTEGLEEGMTLLDHLVLETDDRAIIRDSLANMLVAGRDSTASLLTFTTYALSQHPEVLEKLREEILTTIGATDLPTYDSLRGLKYLRAVINETLRLFPPVPINYRESVEADVWVDEDGTRWFIPAGTSTSFSVMYMHRDKDLWGEDALVFDPMRWIDDRLARLTANPFMFLPFNAGPRICLGQQFVYNEVSFLLVRLLQTFSTITLRPNAQPQGSLPNSSGKWDLTPGHESRHAVEKVWPRSHLTLFVEGGMWAVMGVES